MFGKSAEEAPRLESRGYGRAGDQQSRSGGRGAASYIHPSEVRRWGDRRYLCRMGRTMRTGSSCRRYCELKDRRA